MKKILILVIITSMFLFACQAPDQASEIKDEPMEVETSKAEEPREQLTRQDSNTDSGEVVISLEETNLDEFHSMFKECQECAQRLGFESRFCNWPEYGEKWAECRDSGYDGDCDLKIWPEHKVYLESTMLSCFE